ncbi:hypothetical protein TcCL_Unassigned02615 [Trypanosoma cruzi]|nr:hypothetical protein TcCL_Unassigned02615 [Trypanosoma cruzi]
MESSGRLPFAKELWIIVLRVPRATGPRRCRNSFNMLSWPGAEPSKESRMATSSSYGVRGRSISQPPGTKEVQQQQRQYKVTWHVRPAQNDEQADSPVAEAGRIRGQDQCGAQPIPEDEDAALPCREDIASLCWVRPQVFSRELPTAQRSHGVRLDFVSPYFQVNSTQSRLSPGEAMCVLCMLLLRRTRLVPFCLSISFWSCHGCRAGYGAQLLVRCLRGCPTM